MSEDVSRASRASALLQDDLLIEVLDAIEQKAIDDWANTSPADTELREQNYHKLKASRRLREKLKSIVDDGLVAADRAKRR